MTHRPLLSSLAALTLLGSLSAQANDEADFNQRQAKALNGFAKKALDKGFPRIAKVVWMQVLKLYDADNAEAWTSLGYVKIGSSWNPDPKRPYPTADTGSGAEGAPLQKQHEALEKDLADQHRAQAEKWQKDGRTDRANHHWRMVLRWADGDAQASKALKHVEVGTLSGTEVEQTLYDRSKAVEKVVQEQSKTDYEVKVATGTECPPAVRAQVKYVTVTSEHFVLHGDPGEEENLLEALRWSERTLRICQAAFPWGIRLEQWPTQFAFFTAKETYQQILKANAVPDLEWKLEHSMSSGVGNTLVAATRGKQVLLDACVRNVAQPCSGLTSDGYREGIGHTVVGMIFNNNRLFAVDLKKQQGASASEEDGEYTSPDLDVWKNLSLELAWRRTGGIPANKLPFVEAASFTNEERIKAWSFCDYLLRRDPTMLRTMNEIAEAMVNESNKQPAEFEKRFQEQHGIAIAQLDQDWEDFWTGASPVLKAIQNNTPPLGAISKGADKWLAAFNAARAEFRGTSVRWSANLSTRCREHAEYVKKNKDLRDPGSLHTQSLELGGSYIGSMFAEMALVETGVNLASAKKLFQSWVYKPGYRDALLNPTILTIGMYLDGEILVINAVTGIGSPKASDAGPRVYPPANDTGLIFDGAVEVADMGPHLAKALAKGGHTGVTWVGFPFTLHFGGVGGIPVNRTSIVCNVQTARGEKIEGFYTYDDGDVRTTSAPGMVVFWPLKPIKGKIEFQWHWDADGKLQTVKGGFQAK